METEPKPTKPTTNSLQEMIEKRAEDKLKKDIKKLSEMINDQDLFNNWNNPIKLTFKPSEGKEVTDIIQRLFDTDGHEHRWGIVAQFLLKERLPEYIASETDAFVNRVNQLSQEVQDLREGIENRD